MANKGKYLDVRVKCPYYRKDNNSIDLNCECVYNEVSNIMRFTNPQAKNIHERKRMCHKNSCDVCPLSSFSNGTNKICRVFENDYPSKAIKIVQKWSDENSGPLAKWEINSDGYYPYCSDCGFEPEKISLYCPNCGKKMINSLELMEKEKLKE